MKIQLNSIISACFFFLFSVALTGQCVIEEIIIDYDNCRDGTRNFFINLEYDMTSDSFELRGNGNNYGTFAYADLPITLQDIEPPCPGPMEFVAIDQDFPDCRIDEGLGNLCCECKIREIEFEVSDCNDNQEFFVTLDFIHEGSGTEFSITRGRRSFGPYEYTQLPVTFGPFEGDCDTDYGFLIEDEDNPDCREDFSVGKVCCEKECDIYGIEVDIVECNGDSCYIVVLDFEHDGTGDQFSLSDRSGLIGIYRYDQLPLRINCFPISGRSYEYIKICDLDKPDCCEDFEFEALDCNDGCIRDLVVEPLDCDSMDRFYVEFDFIYDNPGDSGFCITVNGIPLDTLDYDSIYPKLGPIQGGCDTNFMFRVIDKEMLSCTDSFLLEKTCCDDRECELWDLSLEPTSCDSMDMFMVRVNVQPVRTSDSFTIFTPNGSETYAYSQLPIMVGPYLGDCDNRYNFKIVDFSEDCVIEGALEDICCEDLMCEIGRLEFDLTACDSVDNYFAYLDFDYARTSDSFDVIISGGVPQRFAYADLPVLIGPFQGDCRTKYNVLVVDTSNECERDAEFGPRCCADECVIRELIVEASECDSNDMFSVDIDFVFDGKADSICITGNGKRYGKFAVKDAPITIDGLEGDCETDYEFVVRDCKIDTCQKAFELGEICCEEEKCEIGELRFERTECDSNDMFYLFITFDHARTQDSFYLESKLGTMSYAYDDLPIKVGPFEGDCETKYEFLVRDFSEECASDGVFGPVCCEKQKCEIGELKYERTECDSNDMFYLFITFDHARTQDSFYLESKLGTMSYAYDDLPIKIGPLEGDCETKYEFLVRDFSEECASDGVFGPVCCEEQKCEIGELKYERTECDSNDMFYLFITFDHARTQDSFYLESKLGTMSYAYDDLPIKIGPLEGDCETKYEFLVRDFSEECASDGVFGPVCCEEQKCEIGELKYERTECDSNDMFYLFITFDHARTQDSFYLESKLGTMSYAYDDLPIKIGPLEGDCETKYEFVVRDFSEECASDGVFGPVCCEEQKCEIGELKYERTECDSNDMFYLFITFDHARTQDSFYLESKLGTMSYSYDDLPIKIGPLEGDCETKYEFVVRDFSEECATDGVFGPVCCEEQKCEIGELEADAIECNGDSCFVLKLDFDHTGTGGVGFDVFDRAGRVGFYKYEDLPLTIECYPISGKDFEYIKVCDNDNPDCCADIEIEALDCDETSVQDVKASGWEARWSLNYNLIQLIESNSSSELHWNLLDLHGRTISSGLAVQSTSISTDNLQSGVYLFHMRSGSASGTIKVIIP